MIIIIWQTIIITAGAADNKVTCRIYVVLKLRKFDYDDTPTYLCIVQGWKTYHGTCVPKVTSWPNFDDFDYHYVQSYIVIKKNCGKHF